MTDPSILDHPIEPRIIPDEPTWVRPVCLALILLIMIAYNIANWRILP